MNDDLFIVQTRHTAIPDWIALRVDIPIEARNLAHVIMIKSRGPLLPKREDLAELLGVDTRTIDRWLAQLRSAGVLRTMPTGRRLIFTLIDSDSASTPDKTIADRMDQRSSLIADPCDQVSPENVRQFLAQQDAENGQFSTESIADPPVGVVGDHDSSKEKKPTTTNRAPLKTDLARWLKQAGMNAARCFDDPALDYWTYRRFVEEKRAAGWEWRQIVSTLREAPLEPDPRAAPLAERLAEVEPAELANLADLAEQHAPAGKPIEEVVARYEQRQRQRAQAREQ